VKNKFFSDTGRGDAYVDASFTELKEYMAEQFLESTVQTYAADLTLADLQSTGDATEGRKVEYLEQFRQFTASKLEASLESIIAKQELWSEHGAGVGLSGALLTEILHHYAFAHEKCSTFVARQGLVQQAMQHIKTGREQEK
jgi:hypothetical protein